MTPIASGRSADIFDAGPGLVLRRLRRGVVAADEVTAMRVAHAAGFPVPEVHHVDGADMVLDRLDGGDLIAELIRRPWRARSIGEMLGDLHVRLRGVSIDGVQLRTTVEPREALFHGDLHPGNVILTSDGPSVIDWEGAGAGPADADVATTWMLMETAEAESVPLLLRPFTRLVRARATKGFLATTGRPRPATVRAVAELRRRDPNMRAGELERIAEFASRHGS